MINGQGAIYLFPVIPFEMVALQFAQDVLEPAASVSPDRDDGAPVASHHNGRPD